MNFLEIRAEVESIFSKYRVFKRLERINNKNFNIKITPSYEQREHGSTNVTSKPVESLVIREMDEQEERRELIGLIEACAEEMDGLKQDIIKERYMKTDYATDGNTAELLGITPYKYQKTRDAAIKEMAFYLGIVDNILE